MQLIYWLIAIVIAGGVGFLTFRADRKRQVPYPWLTAGFRGVVILATLLLVLLPDIVITRHITEKPIVLLMQDNSQSVGNALGNDSSAYRKRFTELAEKLSGQYKVIQWGFGNTTQPDSQFIYHQQATNIAAALDKAQEYYGLQNLGAVVVASDGRYNEGANPLYQQLSIPGAVYTIAIGDSTRQKDLRIARTYANKVVSLNSTFELRADIVAELCKGYNNAATLREGEETLGTVPLAIPGDKFDKGIAFTIKATTAGLHHYTISLPEAGGEKNVTNNKRDLFVEVTEQKKNILIVSAGPHPDVNAIRDALNGIDMYKTTVVTADHFPESLNDYNVVVLHGIPSMHSRIADQVIESRKPVWFIATTQTDVAALNQLQRFTHVTVSPGITHDVLPAFNTGFTAFTLPQNIQSITDKMPPLTTNINIVMPAPGIDILFQQRAAGTSTPAPMWVMLHGPRPTAMLIGEGIWRWRLYEYKTFGVHNVVDECIRQTISLLSSNNNEKPFNVTMPKNVWSDHEPIALGAYLLNSNNEQINTPDAQLTITDSAGRKQQFSFERSGTAYNLNIGIWAGGTYTYTATTRYNDKTLTASGTFVVESVPLELMETGADYPLLAGLAHQYNGTLFPASNFAALYDSISQNDKVKPLIRTQTDTVPLVDRKWFFMLILLIATAEWLIRKYWLAQ